jgi:sulfatase maturation enzyme AslB (radical SAM superfamily)
MTSRGAMEITTVIGCKVNCRFCPQKTLIQNYSATGGLRKMSFETFVQCIDKLPREVRVDFSGMAEPWLNEQCTEMLLYAARKGHLIAVYTTLVGMSPADFEQIRDVEYDYWVMHLPDADGNTKIAVTEEYLSLLGHILDTELNVLTARQISCHGTLHPEVDQLLRGRYPVFNTMINRAGNLQEGLSVLSPVRGPIMCGRAGRELNRNVLLPDGGVTLCCMDYGMKHVLGNLAESTYQEVLSGPEATRVLAAMDDETQSLLCRSCTVATPLQ